MHRMTSVIPSSSRRREQLAHPELLGTDALDGVQRPLQDVVATGELARLLHRDDVPGVLHHADHGGVATVVEADGALAALGHVEAPGAQGDPLLHGDDGLGQPQRVLGGHLQQVEGDPLRRLRPDAGQPTHLVDEGLERPVEDGHLAPPPRRRGRPAGAGPRPSCRSRPTSRSSASKTARSSSSSSGRSGRRRPGSRRRPPPGARSSAGSSASAAGGAPSTTRTSGTGGRTGRPARPRPRAACPRTGCGGSRWAGRTGPGRRRRPRTGRPGRAPWPWAGGARSRGRPRPGPAGRGSGRAPTSVGDRRRRDLRGVGDRLGGRRPGVGASGRRPRAGVAADIAWRLRQEPERRRSAPRVGRGAGRAGGRRLVRHRRRARAAAPAGRAGGRCRSAGRHGGGPGGQRGTGGRRRCVGAGAGGPTPGGRGRRPRAPDASRRSIRASRAAGESSASGWTSRTSATSRLTRGSGASRIATWARPRSSMARTRAASPTRPAWAASASRSAPATVTSSGATRARKPWRRWSTRSTVSCWGLKPAAVRWATATRARSTSRSASASTTSSSSGRSSSTASDAATWSRIDRASRAEPRPAADGEVEGVVAHVEVGVVADLGEQLGEGVGPEQAELEVLGPAADGGQDLLGVGGGQHEDHVGRRLLERLQQRVGRRRREHVDLVDDVDLLAARRAEGGPGHQVAHGVDAVVGGGVELVDVERRAPGDLHARRADTARLAVVEVGAVEGLGQDAGRRGLAGAPGAAEQVGVGHPAVPHGVAQGQDHVVLAAHLGERRRTEAPVEGLVGNFLGHVGHVGSLPVGSDTVLGPDAVRDGTVDRAGDGPGGRCDGQVDCGTRP